MERLLARNDLEVVGPPAIERYVATQIPGGAIEQIEIVLPINRR